jgi:Kdo2-lipid IVA lauroyltransferase/acyltransferase
VTIPARRVIRGRVLTIGLRAVSAVVRRLSLSTARAIGVFIGQLGWLLLWPDRGRAIANITAAFPDWSRKRCLRTVRSMFHHLGKTLAETLWLPNLNAETLARTTTFEGLENLPQSEGAIGITGHCGNWEWLAHAIARHTPLTVLHRERDEAEMNDFATELRHRSGISTIDRGSTGAGREMIRALRRGSLLGFLIDQSIRSESVRVTFFGRPALAPLGPARLAITTGVPIIRMFCERRGDKLHIRILAPILAGPDDDAASITARLTADIEEQIRRVPEQWVWMHGRWRIRSKWEVVGNEKAEGRKVKLERKQKKARENAARTS